MHRLAAAAAVLGFPGLACAQQPQVQGSNVALTFTWTEVNPVGAPNNVLEPGEGARISLTVTMTPASGSPVTWNTAIGGSGSGELRAFQGLAIDLLGTGGAEGVWSQLEVHDHWALQSGVGVGTPVESGTRLDLVFAAQFPPSQGLINLTNPVTDIWHGTWTPRSYAPRTVSFQSANWAHNFHPFATTVIVRDSVLTSTVFVGTSDTTYGSVSIPIIPAPSALAVLGMAGLLTPRRRG